MHLILNPVYDNEKENYAIVKKLTITETIRLHRLRWFGHVQRMEENRIPKRVLYMNLETARLRSRPRNRWQDEVREDGRIVGGEEWQEKVYNGEDWKKLLRTARNRHVQSVYPRTFYYTATFCETCIYKLLDILSGTPQRIHTPERTILHTSDPTSSTQ
jgi:hypothetical protein